MASRKHSRDVYGDDESEFSDCGYTEQYNSDGCSTDGEDPPSELRRKPQLRKKRRTSKQRRLSKKPRSNSPDLSSLKFEDELPQELVNLKSPSSPHLPSSKKNKPAAAAAPPPLPDGPCPPPASKPV